MTQIDLNKLKKVALEDATKRMENGGHISVETRSMLKHCATEVVEATEAYTKAQWQLNKNENEIEMEHFASELADIIVCVLIIAGKEDIDIEGALLNCMEKNKIRANGTGDKL